MAKYLTICGTHCEIALRREDGGYSYTVKRVAGPVKVLICMGWTAGSQVCGLAEAKDHATQTLASRAG
jgi:hypothetical protein